MVVQKRLKIVWDRFWQIFCNIICCSAFSHVKWTLWYAKLYAKLEVAGLIFLSAVKMYNTFWGIKAGRPHISNDVCLNWLMMSVISFIVSVLAVQACDKLKPVWLVPFMVYQSFLWVLCAVFFAHYIKAPSEVQVDFEQDTILAQVPSLEEKIHNADPDALAIFYMSAIVFTLLIRMFFIRRSVGCLISLYFAGAAAKEENGDKQDCEVEAGQSVQDDGQEKLPHLDLFTGSDPTTDKKEDCTTVSEK